jgi:PhzF family phenazine biosynthesis protein
LTSVTPRHEPPGSELESVLNALAWTHGDLDETLPPARAFAGAWHLVIAVRTADRLAHLRYDMARMKQIMLDAGLTTLQLIWRESPSVFHARNPFPVGGVFEDPATGAAAAALGGYLRDSGIMKAPAYFDIRQGEVMGRPSHIHVHVPETGGIEVSGAAVFL